MRRLKALLALTFKFYDHGWREGLGIVFILAD